MTCVGTQRPWELREARSCQLQDFGGSNTAECAEVALRQPPRRNELGAVHSAGGALTYGALQRCGVRALLRGPPDHRPASHRCCSRAKRPPRLWRLKRTLLKFRKAAWYRVNVKKSPAAVLPKQRSTTTGMLVGTRFQADLLEAIDAWRKSQSDLPTRPEAVRRLVELGMGVDIGPRESLQRGSRALARRSGSAE